MRATRARAVAPATGSSNHQAGTSPSQAGLAPVADPGRPRLHAGTEAVPRLSPARHTALEVQASYLQAGFAQVTASYGSMYGYAVHGLGLSPQTIAKLRHKLLVG